MLSPTAIVSLACLLSTGEVDSANKLVESVSQQELVQIQKIVDSGVCLPEKFNRLINRQNNPKAANPGTHNQLAGIGSAPTSDF